MTLGERLKEERKRLGYTQEELSGLCETNKRQQIKYEQDAQAPGAGYLALASGAGLDVAYVLAGVRTGELNPQESALLAAYRSASEELQNAVLALLGSRLAKPAKPKKTAKVVFKDNQIGQQITTTGTVDLKGMSFTVGDKPK
ncbi:MAG: helix-turn-helix domain-containing protein [Stenotrophomonas koreensis]